MRTRTRKYLIIISSIIFIIVMGSIFFLLIYGKEIISNDSSFNLSEQYFLGDDIIVSANNTILIEQTFIGPGIQIGKTIYQFYVTINEARDAKKYGAYIITGSRYKSTSRTTCYRRTGSYKTPCYYYKCKDYRGYEPVSTTANSDNKCMYIKYPISNY